MYICSDTNVWLDFHEIGHLEFPFRLQHQYYISRNTFIDEFLESEQLKVDQLEQGLQLADLTEEEYEEALAFREKYHGVSLYDAFAFAVAKKRDWVLLSGDMPLRRAAKAEGVECRGTIWICDQLKEQGKVTDVEYKNMIDNFIDSVLRYKRRLPLDELQRRSK